MKRINFFLAALLCFGIALVCLAPMVLAQDNVPGSDIDPSAAATGLIDAIGGAQWGLVIGFGIMLIVWVLRVFVLKSLNTKYLPWVATIMGGAGAFAAAMVLDPSAWLKAIMAGVEAGLAAAGTWGLLAVARKKADG